MADPPGLETFLIDGCCSDSPRASQSPWPTRRQRQKQAASNYASVLSRMSVIEERMKNQKDGTDVYARWLANSANQQAHLLSEVNTLTDTVGKQQAHLTNLTLR